MQFDGLKKSKAGQEARVQIEAVTSSEFTPEDIRRKISDPKDPIHAQIIKAVRQVSKSDQYSYNQDLIPDLVQEVSLKIFEKAENFIAGSSLNPWIYGIAYHTFLDSLKYRKAQSRSTNKTESLEELANTSQLESHLSLTEQQIIDKIDNEAAINSFKEKITSDEFALLEMRLKQGLSNKEIAALLHTTEMTVRHKFFKLFQKIREINSGKDAGAKTNKKTISSKDTSINTSKKVTKKIVKDGLKWWQVNLPEFRDQQK